MKKTFAILAMLLFSLPAFAADTTMELDFAWTQATADLPSLREWGLYIYNTPGGTKPAPNVVAYTTGNGPFTTSQTFTVTGFPGTTVRRYFVMDALSKTGNRTGFSNEVFYDFPIPFSDVTTPMSLTVTIHVR